MHNVPTGARITFQDAVYFLVCISSDEKGGKNTPPECNTGINRLTARSDSTFPVLAPGNHDRSFPEYAPPPKARGRPRLNLYASVRGIYR